MVKPKRWSTTWGGRDLTIETGHFAFQAQGSCTVQYGDTVVLATVVKSENTRAGIDYFPLMVDFEEKLYAAGKIKGSRFIKREGRPSDEAILAGRMVDRAIRPLFDDRVRNDVQVVTTILSIDGENDAATTALIAASCAVAISPVRWDGPIAAARVGRVNGQFVLNVTTTELVGKTTPAGHIPASSDLDLVVAGTPERLVMVEAGAKEVPESEMLVAMQWGCKELQPVIELIKQVQAEVGVAKEELPDPEEVLLVADQVKAETRAWLFAQADTMIFDSVKVSRKERNSMINALKIAAAAHLTEKGFEPAAQEAALKQIKESVCDVISKRILEKEQRLDGRALTHIRPLTVEVDLLPRVHGSAMFMRGDTQVLSVVTLGAPGDVQTLDTMEEEGTKRYMHHYNDAPFTYGEAGPMRGPGRRAIGHGALAERAIEPVLPDQTAFPYAIRVVSEVLGSNGSSSMASTCGSTLSLMAAGVPIKKPVAGIAMGLASDEKSNWKVLTDLQDVEDGKGGMDFKIAGTSDGITAIQMDTKTQGLSWQIVEQTLSQAAVARKEILASMAAVIPAPRSDLSPYAPRIVTIMINPEKIRDVIGPGGKVINKIIADTGVQIDIEQDGRVMVTSNDAEGMKKAVAIIEQLTHDVAAGEMYDGTVVRLEDFGAFVNILPGKDGLVHVSEISWQRVGRPSDVLKMGDKVKVKVKEIDNLGRVNLTMKELLPKPEGYVEYQARSGSGFPSDKRGFDGPRRPFGRRGH